MRVLRERVNLFGLNPRYVFSSSHTLHTISATISNLKLRQIRSMLAMLQESKEKVVSGDIKGVLAHVIPPYDKDADYYELPPSPSFRFASDAVASMVVDRLNALSQQEDQRQAVLSIIIQNNSGAVFEAYVHAILSGSCLKQSEQKSTFQLRSLDTGRIEDVVLKKYERKVFDEISEIQAGAYYWIPRDKRFAAIDSIFVDNSRVLFFQSTIADKHPISHDGLLLLLNSDVFKRKEIKFIFAVPLDKAVSYKRQPFWKNKQEVHTVDERITSRVSQYVLPIDLGSFYSSLRVSFRRRHTHAHNVRFICYLFIYLCVCACVCVCVCVCVFCQSANQASRKRKQPSSSNQASRKREKSKKAESGETSADEDTETEEPVKKKRKQAGSEQKDESPSSPKAPEGERCGCLTLRGTPCRRGRPCSFHSSAPSGVSKFSE